MNEKLLRIYLNDHLAGSTGGVELVARCRRENEGHPLGAYMEQLLGELEEDRALLRDLLGRIGGTENVVKQAGAWLLEKVERLKPDGSPFAYSDLNRVVEMEALLLGVRGRLALLCVLEAIHEPGGPFSDLDFPRLKQRAEQQLDAIERHRTDAARRAFAPSERETEEAP